MDAKETANPVDRAVADIRRATNRLIKLLASEDEAVGQRAAAALAMIDPPPIWALTDVLIQSGDKGLRLKVVAALGRIAEAEQIRVLCALGTAYMAVKDPDVRMAMVDAMLGMKMAFEQAGQAPTPGPAPHGEGPTHRAEVPDGGDGTEDVLPAWRRRRHRSRPRIRGDEKRRWLPPSRPTARRAGRRPGTAA